MTIKDFTDALDAYVVIENICQSGPIPVTELLALQLWFDRRQAQINAKD